MMSEYVSEADDEDEDAERREEASGDDDDDDEDEEDDDDLFEEADDDDEDDVDGETVWPLGLVWSRVFLVGGGGVGGGGVQPENSPPVTFSWIASSPRVKGWNFS